MKQTLLFFTFFLFTIQIWAQDVLVVNPNPYIIEFSDVDLTDYCSEPVAHAEVTNLTNETVLMVWEREIVDAPAEWEFRVCDGNQCYASFTWTTYDPGIIEEPDTLTPGEVSLLDLHVLPRQVAGTCQVKVHLMSIDNPGEVLTTAVFEVSVPTAVSEVEKAALRVFPNPATDYFMLDNQSNLVDELVVYNVLGKRVRSFPVVQGGKYNVADLPNGMYLVTLLNREEGILKTVRVSKRNYRP